MRFHSTSDIGWYGAAYALTLAALQPLTGNIFALFSLKWAYLGFIAIFLFGSVLCAAAVNSNMFICGRAVAGMGASGLLSGAMTIITLLAPLERRPVYIGVLTSLFGVATILGPLIGGLLTSKASWRWCFIINCTSFNLVREFSNISSVPGGGITVVLLLLLFNPPQRSQTTKLTLLEKLRKLDLIGCTLFSPAIVMLLLALQWGGHQHSWKSATIIGLFCGSVVVFCLFLSWERYKGDEAMIPFSVLLNRSVFLSCVFHFLLIGSMLICSYYLPEWFQVIKNASATHSGVMQLPSIISQVFTSVLSGALISRFGYYNPLFFVGIALLSVATGLYTTFTPTTSHTHWISYQVLQGLGIGTAFQAPLIAVQAVFESRPQHAATAVSLVLFFQYFGSSSFLSIGLTIFQNALTRALREDAGLDKSQIASLIVAGTKRARDVAAEDFPEKLTAVINAYNKAITRTFFLSIAATILGFFVAFGIEWKNVKGKKLVLAADKETASSKSEKPADRDSESVITPIQRDTEDRISHYSKD